MINWQLLPFKKLTTHQLYELLQLRVDVFVVEQNCPYPELDGKDRIEGVQHLLGYKNGEIVACARLIPPGVSYKNASIGRIIARPSERGTGLGHELMRTALENMEVLWPDVSIDIQAQEHLTPFYTQHGFVGYSDSYLEDGIPHVDMRLSKH